jgi:hypothetical protein
MLGTGGPSVGPRSESRFAVIGGLETLGGCVRGARSAALKRERLLAASSSRGRLPARSRILGGWSLAPMWSAIFACGTGKVVSVARPGPAGPKDRSEPPPRPSGQIVPHHERIATRSSGTGASQEARSLNPREAQLPGPSTRTQPVGEAGRGCQVPGEHVANQPMGAGVKEPAHLRRYLCHGTVTGARGRGMGAAKSAM